MEIRVLRASDDRSRFRSGEPELDEFLARFAGQNQFRRHIATSYVAVEAGKILAFATVTAGHIEVQRLPAAERRGLPSYPCRSCDLLDWPST